MTTRMRMLAAGAATALTLGVGASLAGAAQTGSTTTTPPSTTVDMNAMHDQMRTFMPEGLQAQCDAMHASMQGQMSGGMGAGMGAGGMRRSR